MTFSDLAYLADAATDADVLRELAGTYGRRALALPPVALVIAAYNEEGAVGQVVEALPRTVCGLAAEVIVVAGGCVDATAKEAGEAGAIVADVPVNRGQGAALLIGVIARGYRVLELPATIHKRRVGGSKKGQNLFYGARFTRVVLRTWWRERRRG